MNPQTRANLKLAAVLWTQEVTAEINKYPEQRDCTLSDVFQKLDNLQKRCEQAIADCRVVNHSRRPKRRRVA
jgi:hypothetical protein